MEHVTRRRGQGRHQVAIFLFRGIIFTCLQVPVVAPDLSILRCFTPCANNFTGNEIVPNTDCSIYHECYEGVVRGRRGCEDLAYNVVEDYCDFVWNLPDNTCMSFVECIEETPEPTPAPSVGEYDESLNPQPTQIPTTPAPYAKGGNSIELIRSKRDLIEAQVLVSNRFGIPTPSKRYKFDRLVRALQLLAVDGFGAPIKFNLWHDNLDMYVYGLVNLAAFLANAMVESIDQDTCSEINWQDTQGRYALSNACGQESRSYQDEVCEDPRTKDTFSCPVLEDMVMNSDDVAEGDRVAPPLKCKPGEGIQDQSGYWDSNSNVLNDKTAYSNDLGRTDLQGCCWWGRGALKTRGVCNIGKFNYYLGKRGMELDRPALYDIDFCQFPEAPCASKASEELPWTVGLFEWAERIQRYEADDWSYTKELMMFVDGGLRDDSFIESASRVLVRNCHEKYCSPYEVRQLERRKSNFYLILEILEVERTEEVPPPPPTQKPTYRIEPARTKEQHGSPVVTPAQQLPNPPPAATMAPQSPATPKPTPNPTVPDLTPLPIADVATEDVNDKIAPLPSTTLIDLEGNSAFQRGPLVLVYLVCIISLNIILIRV
mmetsp:Transcript_37135/g.88874  ORF Transcript_37135/g.88874 Transcript_37135/m.88874 type:complete len:600 (-) Transcript_37135:746-2545(-)